MLQVFAPNSRRLIVCANSSDHCSFALLLAYSLIPMCATEERGILPVLFRNTHAIKLAMTTT
jgi:hypothetical protein